MNVQMWLIMAFYWAAESMCAVKWDSAVLRSVYTVWPSWMESILHIVAVAATEFDQGFQDTLKEFIMLFKLHKK